MLLALERKLVYPVPPFDQSMWTGVRERMHAEEVHLETADGQPAIGWLYEVAHPQEYGMFFHGNGENLAYSADFAKRLSDERQMTMFAVEYPGYWPDGSQPSEAAIELVAEAGREWFCQRMNIQPHDIVLFGRSLGGAVAMHLAAESNSRACVLLSTFSSLHDVAARRYWMLPVRRLMRNHYPSLKRMRTCQQPLLQCHGDRDPFVPLENAQQLFAASPAAQKRFVTFTGCGHNYRCPDLFWSELVSFLDQIDAGD
jgi:fermentation-respiration switch protein FrsA (DUF1100 family)